MSDQAKPSVPLLDYGCTPWRISSQGVADLYDTGVKLWTKRDLVDIERQLEQSAALDRFTIQCGRQAGRSQEPYVRGRKAHLVKPFVKYQDYWKLVIGEFDDPAETLYCSYLIGWKNQAAEDFRGDIENWERLFETKRQLWNGSITCQSFKSRLGELLATRRVTKVVCFGLGDFARRATGATVSADKKLDLGLESDASEVDSSMMQHSAALTMAEEIRRHGNGEVRILAQDPWYSDKTKEFLRGKGFEILGNFGGGGFGEVDGETFVFSAWAGAPVKQILADIAWPAAFITLSTHDAPSNKVNFPLSDAESPRTMQMLQNYERCDFPTSPVEIELMGGLHGLKIFARIEGSSE